ncbi:MAG: Eco29kI family restriction endonuclease [Candidatus Delongbacteria bacterium]
MSTQPYNPLDKSNLGKSIADAMLASTIQQLGTLKRFTGAGIYAIYYAGPFEPYAPISWDGKEPIDLQPIYVGKAVPDGGRKGAVQDEGKSSTALFKRLNEHAKSIDQVENLDLKDFHCRYLVVDDIWIPLGERLLINRFAPIWNTLVDGFGNHDPGSGRHKGMRARWDVLHPGRSWALKCKARSESTEQIAQDVKTHLRALVG